MSVVKFECKRCGNCCINLRGRLGELGQSRVLPPFIYEYSDRHTWTLPLHEWEVETLTEEARNLSIELKFNPTLVLWDAISKRPIILGWTIDIENCPFLQSGNVCGINRNKPLVCQAYPLYATGIIGAKPKQKIEVNYGDCKNLVTLEESGKLEKVRFRTLFSKLFDSYGSCLLGMMREEASVHIEIDTIEKLLEQCLIFPEILSPKIIELISNQMDKSIGIFAFLKKNNRSLHQRTTQRLKEIYQLDMAEMNRMRQEIERLEALKSKNSNYSDVKG